MKRLTLIVAVLAVACTAVVAKRIAIPQPTPSRVALGDATFIGKVTALSTTTEKAEMMKDDVRPMRIATVKVERVLLGKQTREVKVGFLDGDRRPLTPQLVVGQEYCLIAIKHPTKADLYVVMSPMDVFAKANPTYQTQVEDVKLFAKLLAEPRAGLTSKKAEERFATAALLMHRYRGVLGMNNEKSEAVPGEESKMILEALAEGDWTNRDPLRLRLYPMTMFGQLSLTEKDGWNPPKDFTKFGEAAKTWLRENAGKYKMTRFVREKLVAPANAEPE